MAETTSTPATTIPMRPMREAVEKYGVPETMPVERDRVSDAAYAAIVEQGIKYFGDAKYSHRKSAITKGTKTSPAREFTAEDALAAYEDAREEFYAAEWRERAERAPALSLEDQVWHDLLEAKFAKLTVGGEPVLCRANAKKGREAVTVASLIERHGSPRGAYAAVSAALYRDLYARKGQPVDEQSIEARLKDGVAALTAAHAKELKARQRAASRLVDVENVVL